MKRRIVPAERIWLDIMPPAEVREPLCEWLRHHGIDPNEVCAEPGWIERDPGRRRIRYLAPRLLPDVGLVEHVVRTVQLEAVPSPFPLTRPDSGST